MTVTEFFGCSLLAYGPPFAMFLFTIANEPVRIIILIASAFIWLLSLLLSSLLWFAVVPLREDLIFGLVFSILFQEIFRFLLYKILQIAKNGLVNIADDSAAIVESNHVLAYVSGLGFGIMSGAFSLVNVIADAVGPATMGLKSGTDMFFLTSSAISLCFILLHTFWNVIFFDAWDRRNFVQVSYVIVTHFIASFLTLLNKYQSYSACIVPLYLLVAITGCFTYKIVGGSFSSFKSSFSFR